MNSFEFFDLVSTDHNTKFKSSPLTREDIFIFFKQSSSKIDIFSGEMFMFNDTDFTMQVERLLCEKNNQLEVRVACGNRIIGIKDAKSGKTVNPFLDMLNRYENSSLYFNDFGLIGQIANGYMHAIIVDGGKLIYLEEPHNYNKYKDYDIRSDSTNSLLIENDYDLGLELIQRYESYMNFDNVSTSTLAFEKANKNTYGKNDFFDFIPDTDFENKEDFERIWLNKLNEKAESLNSVIDINLLKSTNCTHYK